MSTHFWIFHFFREAHTPGTCIPTFFTLSFSLLFLSSKTVSCSFVIFLHKRESKRKIERSYLYFAYIGLAGLCRLTIVYTEEASSPGTHVQYTFVKLQTHLSIHCCPASVSWRTHIEPNNDNLGLFIWQQDLALVSFSFKVVHSLCLRPFA